MEQYILRPLLFLLLSLLFVGLIDPKFRRRLRLYAERMINTASENLALSVRRINTHWQSARDAAPGERLSATGRTIAAGFVAPLELVANAFLVVIMLFIGAMGHLGLYVLSTLRNLTCGCATLLILAYLFVLTLSGAIIDNMGNYVINTMTATYDSTRLAVYNCAVIDPRGLYYFPEETDANLDSAMQIIDAVQQSGSSDYSRAIDIFNEMDKATDADDDLHFIARNNTGCLYLATPEYTPPKGGGTTRDNDEPAPQLMAAGTVGAQQAAGSINTCAEGVADLESNASPISKKDEENAGTAKLAQDARCTVRPMIAISRDIVPDLTLQMDVADDVWSDLDHVEAVVGGVGYKEFDSDPLDDREKQLPLSSEGVYCYTLRSSAQAGAPHRGEGAIFVDRDRSAADQTVAHFTISGDDANLYLRGGARAFALEIDGRAYDRLDAAPVTIRIKLSGTPVTMYQGGRQTETLTLGPNNRYEVVDIDLAALGDSLYNIPLEITIMGASQPLWKVSRTIRVIAR